MLRVDRNFFFQAPGPLHCRRGLQLEGGVVRCHLVAFYPYVLCTSLSELHIVCMVAKATLYHVRRITSRQLPCVERFPRVFWVSKALRGFIWILVILRNYDRII